MSITVALGTSSSWKASRPRGSRAAAIARIVPPWATTSAGCGPARTSSRPASTRAWCSRSDSPSGSGTPRRRQPRRPRLGLLGLDVVPPPALPAPRSDSANRASTCAVTPTAAPTISAVSRARASWLDQTATSPRSRTASASARACSRPRSLSGRSVEPWTAAAGRWHRSRRGARGGSRLVGRWNSRSVSARRPTRSVSSEIRSCGSMLPRLTPVPKCSMNQICWWRWGASKISQSKSISWTISSMRPVRTSPSGRNTPA